MLRPILLVAVLAAGQAQASSIQVLEGREETSSPSIAAVPPLQPEGTEEEPAVAAGPSVVTIEAAVAPEETTAAVGKKKPPRRFDTLVIRGGIYGGAFTQAAPQGRADDVPDDGVPDDDDPGTPPAGPFTVPE